MTLIYLLRSLQGQECENRLISSSLCELSMVTMKHYWEIKSISDFRNPKNVPFGDLKEVISKSRKWKWPVSSRRLLIGRAYRQQWSPLPSNTSAPLTSIDLFGSLEGHTHFWHWGYFKVTKVKIAYVVSHAWEMETMLVIGHLLIPLPWPPSRLMWCQVGHPSNSRAFCWCLDTFIIILTTTAEQFICSVW